MTGRSFSLILLLALVLFCGLFLFFGESATPSNSTVLEKKTTSKETPPITSSPPSFPVEELEPSERRRLDLSAPTSVFPIDCGWFGTVRQPDGKPAEGAKVILIYQNLSQATVTDSQGRYALSWVDADRIGQGSVFLQIAFQGLAVSPRDWPEPASPPIELNIQLRTASTLQVRVLHALERVPLEAFSVSAESAELDSHALRIRLVGRSSMFCRRRKLECWLTAPHSGAGGPPT